MMKPYIVLSIVMLLMQSCKSDISDNAPAARSLPDLTNMIKESFLDSNFERIISLCGTKKLNPRIATSMQGLMKFVRGNHHVSEFTFSTEIWSESMFGDFLPGKVDNRQLKYESKPDGVIKIEWSSKDGHSSSLLYIAYVIDGDAYKLSRPCFTDELIAEGQTNSPAPDDKKPLGK